MPGVSQSVLKCMREPLFVCYFSFQFFAIKVAEPDKILTEQNNTVDALRSFRWSENLIQRMIYSKAVETFTKQTRDKECTQNKRVQDVVLLLSS